MLVQCEPVALVQHWTGGSWYNMDRWSLYHLNWWTLDKFALKLVEEVLVGCTDIGGADCTY